MTRRPAAVQILSFALAAVVTLGMLAGIDGLAGRDAAPGALLLVQQQQPAAATGG